MKNNKTYSGTPDNEVFSTRLFDAILDSGKTHKELSELTGLSVGAISGYVNGLKAPSYFAFKKLADSLHVSYEYLYGDAKAARREYSVFSKKMGLSDKALSCIESSNMIGANWFLDELISSKEFYDAIETLYAFFSLNIPEGQQYGMIPYTDMRKSNKIQPAQELMVDRDVIKRLYSVSAKEMLGKAVDELIKKKEGDTDERE